MPAKKGRKPAEKATTDLEDTDRKVESEVGQESERPVKKGKGREKTKVEEPADSKSETGSEPEAPKDTKKGKGRSKKNVENDEDAAEEKTIPKTRGRAAKQKTVVYKEEEEEEEMEEADGDSQKKRGRPANKSGKDSEGSNAVPPKRGRTAKGKPDKGQAQVSVEHCKS